MKFSVLISLLWILPETENWEVLVEHSESETVSSLRNDENIVDAL